MPVVRGADYEGPDRRAGDHMITVWSRAIAVVGIPGSIAIVLVWFLGSEIPKIRQQVELNHQEILNSREVTRQLDVRMEEQLRLLRWVCAGVQKSDSDRRNCFTE